MNKRVNFEKSEASCSIDPASAKRVSDKNKNIPKVIVSKVSDCALSKSLNSDLSKGTFIINYPKL